MGTAVATIITAMIGLALGLCFVRSMRLEKANKEYFRSRDPIPPRALVEQIKGVVDYQQAEQVLVRLANAIEIDPMKLRPEDPFFGKVHSIESLGGSDWKIDEAFLDECDRSQRDNNNGQHIKTVADYVRFFAS